MSPHHLVTAPSSPEWLTSAVAGLLTVPSKALLFGLVLLLPFHLVIKRVLPEPLGAAWKEIVVGLLVVAVLVRWARIGRASDLGGLRKRLSRQEGVGSERVPQEQDDLETSEVLAWSPSPLDWAVLTVLAVLGIRFLLQVLPAVRASQAGDVRLAAWGLYTLARYIPIYFVVISLAPNGLGLRPYLMAMLLAGALCGLAAALEFGLDRHWLVSQDIRHTYGQYDLFIYGTRVRRAYATFDFPPALGGYLASLLPLTVALIPVARPGWRRAGLVITLGLLAIGLAFTFSRGPWLASLAGFGVLGLLWVGVDRDRGRAIYLAGVLIALAVLFWLIGAVAAARAPAGMGNVTLAQLRSAARLDDPTNIPRTEAWRRSLADWGRRPWLGLGLGRTGATAIRFLPAGEGYATESMVLKLGVGVGVVGLLAYLAVAVSAGWIGLRSYRRLAMGEGLPTEPSFASVRRPFDRLRAGSSAINADPLDRAIVAGLLAGLAVIAAHGLIYQVLEIKQLDLLAWFFLGGISVMARRPGGRRTTDHSDLRISYPRSGDLRRSLGDPSTGSRQDLRRSARFFTPLALRSE